MDNFEDDDSVWGAKFAGAADYERIGPNHNPYVYGDEGDVGGGFLKIGGSTKHKHMGIMKNRNPEDGDGGSPLFRFYVAYGTLVGTRDTCEWVFQGARRAQNSLNVNIVTRR